MSTRAGFSGMRGFGWARCSSRRCRWSPHWRERRSRLALMHRDLAAFRGEYRRTEIGTRYWGWGHFALTTFGSLAAVAVALSLVRSIKPFELALIPLFLVI